MTPLRADVAVIGGGILGLAHAYEAARRGKRVVLFERHAQARGASVRNFGLIWPIGQPPGEMHALALRSREIWLDVLEAAGLPYFPTGSLHVAYTQEEAAVTREFAAFGPANGYECRWMDAGEASERSPSLVKNGLLGGLFSSTELTVDPALTVTRLPDFLAEKFAVALRYGCPVREIRLPAIYAGEERWEVDRAVLCGGDDFETLYPGVFSAAGLIRCKLQMMRTVPQPHGWRLGPALAGGLTLRYYPTFDVCPSLPALKARVASEMPEYDRWGIHVMLSEAPRGEITIGDSHEYGLAADPFDKARIDELILSYLTEFVQLPDPSIAQRWHGVYARHPGMPYFTASPEPGVRIITVTSGIGMTLSFGLAEKTMQEMGV